MNTVVRPNCFGSVPDMDWITMAKELPPDGLVVDTKIDNDKGIRNEQQLVRQGNLMFFPDYSMYVYYAPTHWRLPTGDTNND